MNVTRLWLIGASGLALLAACTKSNPAASCTDNGTCTDPNYPYCDVDGAIGGEPGACIAVSCTAGEFDSCSGSDAALVCNATGDGYETQSCANGCDPGSGCVATSCTASQPLRCDGDQLVSCNADGTGESDEACALGCNADELRCNDLDPSNGLATYLDMASGQPALDMTAGGTIDTDTGAVMVAGQQVNVLTAVATQASGPSIRVLAVKSFTAGDVTVTGTNALAIVSDGEIKIEGTLSVSANGRTPGSGMWTEASCQGKAGASITAPHRVSGGTGGAGFGTPGGHGGKATLNATDGTYSEAGGAGGATVGSPSLVPLRGGCSSGDIGGAGGGGGGAIQIASRTKITIDGVLAANGGGGHPDVGGGGSGGGILLEAPDVAVIGNLVANGGGGASSSNDGEDGHLDATPAMGGAPPIAAGGNGGVGTTPAQAGADLMNGGGASHGTGGGGGVGRIRINTTGTGAVQLSGLVSPSPSTGAVNVR